MTGRIIKAIIPILALVIFTACTKKDVSTDQFIKDLVKDVEIDLSKINRDVITLTAADKELRSYQGDIGRIKEDIDSLLKKYPDSYDMKALKIQFLQRTDRNLASEFVRSLYAKDSLNSHHQFFYGTNLDPEEGREYFVNMIRNKKDDPFGYLGLSFSLLYSGMEDLYVPAKIVYLSILKDPTIDDSFEVLGYILNSLGRKEDLSVLNGIMLVKDPSNTSAFENLFYYYFTENEKEKSFDLLNTFIQNNPGALSNSSIAENYLYLEKYDLAQEQISKARKMKETDTLLDFIESKLKINSGDHDSGVKLLEKYAEANLNDRNLTYRITDELFAEKLIGNSRYLKLLKKVENGAPTLGDKAPSLSGTYLDSSEYSSSAYTGKVYLIDFWAEWCSPCKNEMPNVIAVYNKYNPKGFEIIGVNLDSDQSKDRAITYVKENSILWNHIYSGLGWKDPNVAVYKVNGIPATFLVDSKGVIRYKNIRGEDLLSEKIEKLLEEAVQSSGQK